METAQLFANNLINTVLSAPGRTKICGYPVAIQQQVNTRTYLVVVHRYTVKYTVESSGSQNTEAYDDLSVVR